MLIYCTAPSTADMSCEGLLSQMGLAYDDRSSPPPPVTRYWLDGSLLNSVSARETSCVLGFHDYLTEILTDSALHASNPELPHRLPVGATMPCPQA